MPLWGFLGPPGGLLGRKAPFFSFLSLSWPPLGPVLGASWAGKLEMSVRVPSLGPLLGQSWGPPGLS